MKILLCAKHIAGNGGQEGFLRQLCTFLLARGHEVDIVAARADPVPGATCLLTPLPPWTSRAVWDWAAARAVAAASLHRSRDVSFGGQKMWGCNVLRPGGGVEAEYWRIRLEDQYPWPPLRALARAVSLKRRFDLDAEARGFRDPQLRYIIANSQLVRNGIVECYPQVADKVQVVYNGAELERFTLTRDAAVRTRIQTAIGLDPALRTALFAGHNLRLKGLPQALETLELVNRGAGSSAWQLVVVGGARRAQMQRLAQRLGLAARVRFVGKVPRAEDYFAAADVLLFPTFYDPCANVTLEALAGGIPVITTRRNGASELITDGREGWTMDSPRDIERMAAHLAALRDPARLSDMKQAARALAERHSLDGKLADIETILRDASRLR